MSYHHDQMIDNDDDYDYDSDSDSSDSSDDDGNDPKNDVETGRRIEYESDTGIGAVGTETELLLDADLFPDHDNDFDDQVDEIILKNNSTQRQEQEQDREKGHTRTLSSTAEGGAVILHRSSYQNLTLSIRQDIEAISANENTKQIKPTTEAKLKATMMMIGSNNNCGTKMSSWVPTRRQNVTFSVNDKALVYLTMTKDTYTASAVNKFGYPIGKGRTDEEKIGPYIFVVCKIKNVHFDEADRYYTIERYDNGKTERADPGWMEPLLYPEAIDAAITAARSGTESFDPTLGGTGRDGDGRWNGEKKKSWYIKMHEFLSLQFIPYHQRMRIAAKVLLKELLHGDRPFSCKIRFTGINLLVICSTLFLFLEVVSLGFLPAKLDSGVTLFGTIVWIILIFELIFEILIRPIDYWKLLRSEKAYLPTTARYISQTYVVFECIALLTYIPELTCLSSGLVCTNRDRFGSFSQIIASMKAVLGPTTKASVLGRFFTGLMVLRFFGVIRHWKQMKIRQTHHPTKREGLEKWIPFDHKVKSKKLDDDDSIDDEIEMTSGKLADSRENFRLKNAANIDTALIVVNCYRFLVLLSLSVIILPLFFSFSHQNLVADNLTKVLQANNLVATTGLSDCDYLQKAIESWLNIAIVDQPESTQTISLNETDTFVLWAQVLPVRCPFQNETGTITTCAGKRQVYRADHPISCKIWDNYSPSAKALNLANAGHYNGITNHFAVTLNVREGGIKATTAPGTPESYQFEALNAFKVTVIYNENPTIKNANRSQFYMLALIFVLGLSFLIILQLDVDRLALLPIKRMLRIVVRYAEDPLSIDVDNKTNSAITQNHNRNKSGRSNTPGTGGAEDDIGDMETEQLLSAITKISDLLRKCWGVAGGGIISSNLARMKDGKVAVFNPTVPGKQVYALFGFVSIGGFSELLSLLDSDIMLLINDIAAVVHDEIYRWALGEHGQCNKNLGSTFLMVWRIGDFIEVQKKNKEAIEKMFRDKVYKKSTAVNSHQQSYSRYHNRRHHSTTLRRRTGGGSRNPYSSRYKSNTNSTPQAVGISSNGDNQEVHLESLPGIQDFTDRALLGMLKSFAGIHRDKRVQNWKNDFRLSAGISAFEYTVDVVYGMDAGWAVEGAVGSEYKIDATYLSPHVNMASRMMSASKQYGVTILLSKAVEKLISKNCRSKLRHLDTVYVKGSKFKQSIYTYDARFRGVDFFLLERTPDQADLESEYCTPSIWDRDQDIKAMRQHISQDFLDAYHFGVKQYLAGKWRQAYESFAKADTIMIRNVVEEGYIEIIDMDQDTLERRIYNENDQKEDIVKIRNEFGDGACRTLMNYMERRNLTAPEDWDGVRQLFSK